MKINHAETLEAIQQFLNSDPPKVGKGRSLLMITKSNGKLSLKYVKEEELTKRKLLWEKIKSLFGRSSLNLVRVLSFIGKSAKDHKEFNLPVEKLCEVLRSRVNSHIYSKSSKRVVQLSQIAKLQLNFVKQDEAYTKAEQYMLALLAKEIPDYKKRFSSKAVEYLIQSRMRQIPGKEHGYSRDRLESYNFLIKWLDKNGYEAGFAEDNGYCFYDACAQGVSKELGCEVTYSTLCKQIGKFAEERGNEPIWKSKKGSRSLRDIVETDKVDYATYDEWKNRIDKADVTAVPIWGRAHIEGVIVAETYRVKIRTIEVQKNPAAFLPQALASIIDKERFLSFLKREQSTELKKELFYVHEAAKRIIRLKALEVGGKHDWEKQFFDALEVERDPYVALQKSLHLDLKEYLTPLAVKKKVESMKEEYEITSMIDGAAEDFGKTSEPGDMFTMPEWSSTSPLKVTTEELPEIFMANPGGHFIPVFKKK